MKPALHLWPLGGAFLAFACAATTDVGSARSPTRSDATPVELASAPPVPRQLPIPYSPAPPSGPGPELVAGRDHAVATAKILNLDLDDLPSTLLLAPNVAPLPLVVAAHGAGGSPEWQCEWLRALTSNTQLLLACLRGKPMLPYDGAFYYPEHHTLGRLYSQTLRAIAAMLNQRSAVPHVYVGYSQGATMGALMLHEVDPLPPHLLLVEGGFEGWTEKRCRSFQERGGRKVFFACGTNTCAKHAKVVVERLRKVGVEAQYEWARGAGHTPDGAVAELAQMGLTWLLREPPIPSTQGLR